MKKGKIQISIGALFIILQLFSILKTDFLSISLPTTATDIPVVLYDIIYWASYLFFGILGLLLLVSGVLSLAGKKTFSKILLCIATAFALLNSLGYILESLFAEPRGNSLYYVLSLLALLCWSGSDFFSKKGTNEQDKNSHWKVVFAVGLIMGIHFFITLIGGAIIDSSAAGVDGVPKVVASLFYTDFKLFDFVAYLPVAALYILAMVFGYIGLRYIELSISSPICNSSGALAFLLCVLLGIFSVDDITSTTIIGIIMITIGIVALGFVEQGEDPEIKIARQKKANRKYAKSILAFLLPITYLIIDAIGTVGDEFIFSDFFIEKTGYEISDYAANSAFELTFFLLAIFAFIWIKFVKKDKIFSGNRDLYFGGLCETVGQIFYMAVMFSDFSAGMVIISAYCAISVLWSRIFLKEKLSLEHYSVIALVIAGIVILG